jgi:hypothetical protein
LDRLAKQQACQLFIEQEIEKGLASGKSKYAIGHEIAAWIKKLFEAEVKPNTIEQRAHRMEKQLLTNVSTEPTTENHSEQEEQKEVRREETAHEEKRKLDRERMAPEFRESFEAFVREIKNAKALKWKTTSKESVMRSIQILHDITTIT